MRVMPFSLIAMSTLTCFSVSPVFAQIGGVGGNLGQYGMPQIGNDNGANQQSQPVEQEKKEAGYPADDPIVNSPTPPPASTRMQTKLAWCEVQVYGHSFTDYGLTNAKLPATHMHLPERLKQLNQKLSFMPNKNGVALMDHIDDLVTFVSKRPPATTAAPKKSAE